MILSQNDLRRRKQRRSNRGKSQLWRGRRRFASETLEGRQLLAGDLMHNVDLPTDVNADGYTSPMDALHVINQLNGSKGSSPVRATSAQTSTVFYDVNGDTHLSPVDALLVLNVLNAEAEDHDIVQMRLEVVDSAGNPIDAIDVGSDFELRAYVQDLTGRDRGGVFAGYMDVEYDAAVVTVTGGIEHGPSYGNAAKGDTTTPGLIDEVGSADGLSPLGTAEFLLFSVPMNASTGGLTAFVPSPADISPANDVLVFGIPEGQENGIVDSDQIAFISVTLQVGEVQAPLAVDDRYDAIENEVLTVDASEGVLANDVNPTAEVLTATLETNAINGTVVLADDGSFTYTPNAGFTDQDTFEYFAVADGVQSNTATVTIDVQAVNAAPIAVNDEYSTDEDTPLTISAAGVLGNDTDPDGDALTAAQVSAPSHGTVSLNADGGFVYTPDDDYVGTDSFEYVANDGQLDSNVALVTITIDPVNDPPVAVDDDYATDKNQTLTVTAANGVLSNDFDIDGDALTARLLTTVAHGSLDLMPDGSFIYVPTVDFTGTDGFTYEADDGMATSDPATVTIEVTGEAQVAFRLETVNQFGEPIDSLSPGANFDLNVYVQDIGSLPRDGVFAAYLDIVYDAGLANAAGDVVFAEPYLNQATGDVSTPGFIDEAGAIDGLVPLGDAEFLLFSVPMIARQTEGTLLFSGNPADDLPMNDVLLFGSNVPVPTDQVNYGTVSITIDVGEMPVAIDDDYEMNEDEKLTVDAAMGVLANDISPGGVQLVATLVSETTHGLVELNEDGSFVYTPDQNFFGEDSFSYHAFDGTQVSNVATVTIDVNPMNDIPIAIDDFYQLNNSLVLEIDAAAGVLANDIDVDGDPLTAVLVAGPSDGVVTLDADGSFTYTPDADFFGQDTFTYRAVTNGDESNIATVTIDVLDPTPSTVVGFVYSDVNNDGVLDEGETRYGGVRITLRGEDFFGGEVATETITLADGSYRFTGIFAGDYTLTEFQPLGLVDGKDTIDGELSLRNDRFEIDLPGGSVVGDYNFGERGLAPEFIRDPFFFASNTDRGMFAMMNLEGDMEWYRLQTGWRHLASADIDLTVDRSTAQVTVQDAAGGTDSQPVVVNVTRDARLHKPSLGGQLLRLTGDPEDFGLSPVLAEGELSAEAVDRVFSGDA